MYYVNSNQLLHPFLNHLLRSIFAFCSLVLTIIRNLLVNLFKCGPLLGTSCKWSCSPYKWPYSWVTRVPPLLVLRPPCRNLLVNPFTPPLLYPLRWPDLRLLHDALFTWAWTRCGYGMLVMVLHDFMLYKDGWAVSAVSPAINGVK